MGVVAGHYMYGVVVKKFTFAISSRVLVVSGHCQIVNCKLF